MSSIPNISDHFPKQLAGTKIIIGGLAHHGNNVSYPWIGGPLFQEKIAFWDRYFEVAPELISHLYEMGDCSPSKFTVMNDFHLTQLKLKPWHKPGQAIINDKNRRFVTRLISRLALVSVFNSTNLERRIWKKCFNKTMPTGTPQRMAYDVLNYEYQYNVRVFHKILNVGLIADMKFDSMIFADVETAMERDCTMYMSDGIVGDYVIARKHTQHDKDGKATNTKSYGYVTFNEFFLMYPLITGTVAQPRRHRQVKVANVDTWIQGSMAQLMDAEMSSKLDKALQCVGGEPYKTSAMQKIRALAIETGLAQLGYPIHLTGCKVMKIVRDAVGKTSFEDDL